jgi:hypothetical protein
MMSKVVIFAVLIIIQMCLIMSEEVSAVAPTSPVDYSLQ